MKEVCTGFFTTLANRTRLAILTSLREGKKSVNEIVRVTGYEQSLISHNLKLLKDCRFVKMSVSGKQRIYSLNKETIIPLFELVEQHKKSFCDSDICQFCNTKINK